MVIAVDNQLEADVIISFVLPSGRASSILSIKKKMSSRDA